MKKDSPPLTLYHGMRGPFIGDALTTIAERTINGKKDKYLFGTDYLSMIMQFAFSWNDGEAISSCGVEGTPDHAVVICERSKTLARPIDLTVYSFPSTGFEKAISGDPFTNNPGDTRQYISIRPVPLSELTVAHHIQDIDTLMHFGLQIFGTEKTKDQLIEDGFHDKFKENDFLTYLVNCPDYIWENRRRGININPVLQRLFC